MTFFLYAIGAGYNVALGSLTNFESLSIPNEPKLRIGGMYGTFDPGLFRGRGDGTLYTAGYGSCALPMPGISRGQVRYFQTTYCNSGYWGKVTIYVRLDDPATYTRYNAVMLLPKLSESQKINAYFKQYLIRFMRLAASS